ncbi:protein BatD, partial [bacterium]|nr:protein BatD [bacterium]
MFKFRGDVNRILWGVGFGFLLLGCWLTPADAADLAVSATVDRSTIQLNQRFTITLELSGEKANRASVEPVFPVSLEQFGRLMGRGGESTNMSWINGSMTVSKTVRYNFQAIKVGTFQIDPITLTVNGQNYQTKAFAIKIVNGGQAATVPTTNPRPAATQKTPSPAEALNGQDLFLKATVDKRSVYQNEPVIVSYKIYTRVNITSYGIDKLPNMVGFWQEEFELPQQPQLTDEVINGRRYRVAEIRRVALFPTAIGKKTIEPLTLACDVRVQARRQSNNSYDSFFNDPFFSRSQRQQIMTRPITIEVKPLPTENKPRKFLGAVGAYKLTASVDKQMVETNESIKLKVKVSGTGNIQILPEPKVNLADDFEVYGPTATEQISRTGHSISGYRTLEYVLIPRYAGTREIPAIKFTYFDLSQKEYRTLRTKSWNIEVKKGKNTFANNRAGFSRSEIQILGQDIRYIQQRTPQFSKRGDYVHQSVGFIILLILPLLGLAAAFVYQRQQDRMAGDIAFARERRANRVAVDRLRKAKKKNKPEKQKEFYAEIS